MSGIDRKNYLMQLCNCFKKNAIRSLSGRRHKEPKNFYPDFHQESMQIDNFFLGLTDC